MYGPRIEDHLFLDLHFTDLLFVQRNLVVGFPYNAPYSFYLCWY